MVVQAKVIGNRMARNERVWVACRDGTATVSR